MGGRASEIFTIHDINTSGGHGGLVIFNVICVRGGVLLCISSIYDVITSGGHGDLSPFM